MYISSTIAANQQLAVASTLRGLFPPTHPPSLSPRCPDRSIPNCVTPKPFTNQNYNFTPLFGHSFLTPVLMSKTAQLIHQHTTHLRRSSKTDCCHRNIKNHRNLFDNIYIQISTQEVPLTNHNPITTHRRQM